MDDDATLRELEEAGWRALATAGAAADFYRDVLDDDAVMVFPAMVLRGPDEILPTMAGPPWDAFRLLDVTVTLPGADTGVVTYRVDARRGDHPYRAWLTSVYVRRTEGWRLVLHQHSPDPAD